MWGVKLQANRPIDQEERKSLRYSGVFVEGSYKLCPLITIKL
jgi:hypothetical protein